MQTEGAFCILSKEPLGEIEVCAWTYLFLDRVPVAFNLYDVQAELCGSTHALYCTYALRSRMFSVGLISHGHECSECSTMILSTRRVWTNVKVHDRRSKIE